MEIRMEEIRMEEIKMEKIGMEAEKKVKKEWRYRNISYINIESGQPLLRNAHKRKGRN